MSVIGVLGAAEHLGVDEDEINEMKAWDGKEKISYLNWTMRVDWSHPTITWRRRNARVSH